MAKDKTKRGRIPKRVAGIKVPKELRRKGKMLLDKADTPRNREMLATGLGMVAAAAAAAAAKRAAAGTGQPGEPGEPGVAPGRDLGDAVAGVAGALQRWLVARQ